MIDSILNSKLSPLMIFVLVILAILLYYFHKPLQEILRNISFKKSKKQDIKSLKSHDLFCTLQRVKQEALFLKFYSHGKFDETKSRMCGDFVRFKCDVCTEMFHDFLDSDLSVKSNDELKQHVISEMYSMHNTYVGKIKSHWLDKGIDKDSVDYVVQLFESFRHGVVMSFQHRIDSIFACEHYETNFDKILACYEMYSMGIDLLPKDLQDTFESMNGKFASINYN